MPDDGNVSRRAVLARLAVGTAVASGMAENGVAESGEPGTSAGRTSTAFASQTSQTGLYGGEYVLERRDEYAQVMPVNVILRTDTSLEEIRRVLRDVGWTTVAESSLSGAPKYARNASGEPVQAGLDVADGRWSFAAQDQRVHASMWTFHEENDDLRNVSIAAHVDAATWIEMKLGAKFSELVGDSASDVSPGHRGERFDAARERLVEVFTANGWEEVGRVEYAADHGNEGRWRDHDGFAAVLESAGGTDEAGGTDADSDAGGFPYEIQTGSATADGKEVTFEGSVTAPSGEVTVGFAWQDDNAMWGETDSRTFAPEGTREFSITGEVPRNAFDYPYYAWAVFHDHGEARYRGEVREVRVPDFSDTVAIETLGIDAGSESATIRGRVADFGQASELPVGGEVTEDGGIWQGVSTETRIPDDDPVFEVEIDELESGTEYRGRAFGQVPSGAGSARVTGEAVSFTTDGRDEDGDVSVETGEASPDSETPRFVTFTGRIEGLAEDATAEVGFEYQDYNAMWGETATEEVSGGGGTEGEPVEFTITEQMPYVGREFPYRAVATVEDSSGTEEYVGETRRVSLPNFVDTVAVETVDVTASGTTATVHGRIADFGQATEVLANAEVWRPGSNSRTSRTERVSLSADGSAEFEVRLAGLDPDADYRARTLAEIPAGPTYATTYGNEVDFTTGGGDSGADESTTTQTDSEAEGETGADSGTTTTTDEAAEPTPTTTTEEADAAGAAAEEPTTTTTEEEPTPTTTTEEPSASDDSETTTGE